MQHFSQFPEQAPATPILDGIDSPRALRALTPAQLVPLADQVRAQLLFDIGRNGGHLGAGLGVVELTLALHFVLDTPHDRLVWDVGHQAYPHKMLTGRRAALSTIRQSSGLAPFPSRNESEWDCFGVGHAGTAISAATGMALAAQRLGEGRQVCAVVGDGALSSGMSLEALAHAGGTGANLLVVLNDNGMSISSHVGALAERFPSAEQPLPADIAAFFETFGFSYTGPVDGHDLPNLLATLGQLTAQSGPRLLHVVTRKGAGFAPAEADALSRGHAHSPASAKNERRACHHLFGEWASDTAAQDNKLLVVTPAMREGSGLTRFAERWPDRFFDVGIAEQHAVTLAAGMACEGTRPVVALYSTFLQRAVDQIIHDVAVQHLPVTLAVDRAGLVGEDGVTHHGIFDIALLRAIPDVVLMAPSTELELKQMLDVAHRHPGLAAVRYPRGALPAEPMGASAFEWGRGRWLRRGQRNIALLNTGALLDAVLEAAEQLDVSVIDLRFVKPLDRALVLEVAGSHRWLVSVEDHAAEGGAGSAIAELLAQQQREASLLRLGVPDCFIEHGKREELLAQCGLDAAGIVRRVEAFVAKC
ncbi:1-deoxy-D-xylulose-5-phosphate synthase [Carnimonas nigrificans]|uniref:1-deoxy-D-xylulose-5-phosphate synthase n=1 Tax=Carnimonas nigrificans TaxID=64323 RepID=UPI00046F2428|nr:1-deoxy-D-xylulose-5-phosphate synthase [Carnimonas nigrificans]